MGKEISITEVWDNQFSEAEIRKIAMRGLSKLGQVILGDAKKIVPRGQKFTYTSDSGKAYEGGSEGQLLANSGHVTTDNAKGEVTISFATPYARIQHEGGTIYAKKKKYLMFLTPNGWVKKKFVTIKAKKYLERPFDEHKGSIKFYIENELAKQFIKKKYGEFKT